MLSYNVADLLRSAPGTHRRYAVEGAALDIDENIELAAPIEGEVQLSRTGRSIVARAELKTAIRGQCARCLQPVVEPIEVMIEEEALPSIDIDSGQPVDRTIEPDALRLDAHHELDLDQPVRDAIVLAEPISVLCRPDCAGLCPVCGADMNADREHGHPDEAIDPRLAGLAEWRPTNDSDKT
ncbi:MAG TPA: DUF177 domain-containing protein [Candidatus Limnocylindria bacterium]|nr:DUF177 domain-containing protein [Candidatus Limnocylindria bacterium]